MKDLEAGTLVMATLASSETLQLFGRQSLINFDTIGVGRFRSSGLSAIAALALDLLQLQPPQSPSSMLLWNGFKFLIYNRIFFLLLLLAA